MNFLLFSSSIKLFLFVLSVLIKIIN